MNVLADATADLELLLKCELGVCTTPTYDRDAKKCHYSIEHMVACWCYARHGCVVPVLPEPVLSDHPHLCLWHQKIVPTE